MCSLEEAWQDINFTSSHEDFRSKVGDSTQQQIEMDRQHSVRAQQEMDIRVNNTYQPDKVGNVVDQANDRRQYSKPAQDIFHHDWQERTMKRPIHNNQFIRGVHDKYNRNSPPRVANQAFRNNDISMVSEMNLPAPANDNGFTDWNSLYMLNPQTQKNNNASGGDKFTQEFINNNQLQNESNLKMIEYNRQIDQSVNNNPTPNTKPNNNENNENNNIENNTNNLKQKNLVEIDLNKKRQNKLEEEIMKLMKEIKRMELRMKMLEQKMVNVDNNRSHDIILYGVVLVFVLFIVYQTFMG